VLGEALAQVKSRFHESDAAIVAGSPGWHPGVIGIVASRLMRQYHRPTLVVAFDERDLGKGSGRSIAGFSLVAALEACGHHLQKHGGHEMAAGLSIQLEHFDLFRTAFLAHARAALTDDHLRPRLQLEAELPLREIGLPLLERHEQLQPFGTGNPQPLFFARGVTFAAEPRVLKEKHLALRLRQGAHQARAIWFGGVEENPPPPPWDIAYRLERNEYQGTVEPQIQIKAVRPAA
jgi:single-stranded-DNA-specific exonuclease